jgi:septum formation protein
VRVILASASQARLGVLRSAGLDPLVEVSDVDEDAVQAALGGAAPAKVVTALACAKAGAVGERLAATTPDAIVIGCDSMLSIDGALVGKPGTREQARRRWAVMAGRSGQLVTGHAVLRLGDGAVGQVAAAHAATTVHFGRPSEAELDAYVASEEPLHVAGGFTLDGLGGWFVTGIEGDPSNVIGISLPLLRTLLAEVGVVVTDLWNRTGGDIDRNDTAKQD